MVPNKDLIGKRLLIQRNKDSSPEVWLVTDVRDSYFGTFVEFKASKNETVVTKLDTLYTVKFI